MKKITFVHWVCLLVMMAVLPLAIESCNQKQKKPETVLVTPVGDTTKIIDTTIIEPGVAPLANIPNAKINKTEKQKKEKVICSFGQKKFNTRKRPIEEAPGGVKGKKPKPGTPPLPPPDEPPPGTAINVVYINFFGDTINNTMWNVSGPLIVGDAGLAQSEFDYIRTQVEAGLLPYNVQVTYDESVFNAAPLGHKIEIIVTEDWQWFGMAGGVAYINSWWWNYTPGFVFSTLLNYNGHHIAEAIRHEASHTLGLRHQSDCDNNGAVINQYRLGWTMGNSYSVNLGIYGVGTSSMACATQDDNAILTSALGLKQ